MKKTQWDLLNWLGLRIGDTISTGGGDFDGYMIIHNKESDYIYLFNCGQYFGLEYLIGRDFEIRSRKKTYADKWDDLRKVCDEMLTDFDVYGVNMGIAQVLAYTRKALIAMDMTDELSKFNHEVAKCVSIDLCDEEGE